MHDHPLRVERFRQVVEVINQAVADPRRLVPLKMFQKLAAIIAAHRGQILIRRRPFYVDIGVGQAIDPVIAVSVEFVFECMGVRLEVAHDDEQLPLSTRVLMQDLVQGRDHLFVSHIGPARKRGAGYGDRRTALQHAQFQKIRKYPAYSVEQGAERPRGEDGDIGGDRVKAGQAERPPGIIGKQHITILEIIQPCLL
jgi:hypothetical protein